jgi:hypothetical protein
MRDKHVLRGEQISGLGSSVRIIDGIAQPIWVKVRIPLRISGRTGHSAFTFSSYRS